ncbi:MAG: hypothetical protein LBQ42_04570 [Synergistaceae bacterium]|nr:hypothetical protein [Synergistaceae bacterium]
MRKLVLVFAVVALAAFSGVAYAADGGHGGGVIEKPVDVAPAPPAVIEKIVEKIGDVVEVAVGAQRPELTDTATSEIASSFGGNSKVASFPTVTATESGRVVFEVPTTNLVESLNVSSGYSASNLVLVLWHRGDVAFTTFRYASSISGSALSAAAADPTFTFVDADGNVVTKIEGAEIYPVFDVVDGAPYDRNGSEPGVEIAPAVVDGQSSGGGGGCDAGFSGAALLLLAAGWVVVRKR